MSGDGPSASTDRAGSSEWTRAKLAALGSEWLSTDAAASDELFGWLYRVAVNKARALGVPASDRAEVAQDAMPKVVCALRNSRARITSASNPAAMLERIVGRAVGAAVHRWRMQGFGAVRPNGRDWHALCPPVLKGEPAERLLEVTPDAPDERCARVEEVAKRLAAWVSAQLDIELVNDAVHAVTYVMDRLVAGVSRPTLVRGGRGCLAVDPAMRHLGFEPVAAAAFARWLLGRTDVEHEAPSVLDAFLSEQPELEPAVIADWRRLALGSGFGSAASAAGSSPQSRRIA